MPSAPLHRNMGIALGLENNAGIAILLAIDGSGTGRGRRKLGRCRARLGAGSDGRRGGGTSLLPAPVRGAAAWAGLGDGAGVRCDRLWHDRLRRGDRALRRKRRRRRHCLRRRARRTTDDRCHSPAVSTTTPAMMRQPCGRRRASSRYRRHGGRMLVVAARRFRALKRSTHCGRRPARDSRHRCARNRWRRSCPEGSRRSSSTASRWSLRIFRARETVARSSPRRRRAARRSWPDRLQRRIAVAGNFAQMDAPARRRYRRHSSE